jgi:hypothetical protein
MHFQLQEVRLCESIVALLHKIMAEKRKHRTLTLLQKYNILQKLEDGQTVTALSKEYGVGKATISDIKKKKEKIKQFIASSEAETSKRKTIKQAFYPAVDSAVYTWFLQERCRNTPISGEILREKARYFYQKITGKNDFQASLGWLDKFKNRFGIRQLTVSGEKLSSDITAIEPFKNKFLQKIGELGLTPDQVYNADESGLFWRVLPNKTLVHKNEDSAPGRKISKERITFMPCANSTGTHKLKLLVIGKARKPRAFTKTGSLPVIYKGQPRAWVTQDIFKEWFFEEFVPAVRRKMSELKLPKKALLVLDNAPGHPSEDELLSDDGQITTMFLPPNCTPILQPMDQNVIQAIKLHYRKTLLLQVVSAENDISETLKKLNLKDVVYSLEEAWQSVSVNLITKSWKNLWPNRFQDASFINDNQDNSYDEEDLLPLSTLLRGNRPDENTKENELAIMTGLLNNLSKGGNLTRNEVRIWAIDNEDEKQDITFTDDEIVAEVVEQNEPEEDEPDTEEGSTLHSTALAGFNICIQWATENGIPLNQILLLRQMREKAMKLHINKSNIFKQTSIKDFFLNE